MYVCVYTNRLRLTDILSTSIATTLMMNNEEEEEKKKAERKRKERKKCRCDIFTHNTAEHSYHTNRERQEKKTLCAYKRVTGRVIVSLPVKMRSS